MEASNRAKRDARVAADLDKKEAAGTSDDKIFSDLVNSLQPEDPLPLPRPSKEQDEAIKGQYHLSVPFESGPKKPHTVPSTLSFGRAMIGALPRERPDAVLG